MSMWILSNKALAMMSWDGRMSGQKHYISKGDQVEINGRHGVVTHLTSQRCWILHVGDRVSTGYSRGRFRRYFLRYDVHNDQLVKSFSS